MIKSTDDSTISSSSDESEQPSIKKLKQDSRPSSSICYICQLASLPGRFFPKKAKELGVPRGPLFAELHSGKAVTLEDGRQVSLKLHYTLRTGVLVLSLRRNKEFRIGTSYAEGWKFPISTPVLFICESSQASLQFSKELVSNGHDWDWFWWRSSDTCNTLWI